MSEYEAHTSVHKDAFPIVFCLNNLEKWIIKNQKEQTNAESHS